MGQWARRGGRVLGALGIACALAGCDRAERTPAPSAPPPVMPGPTSPPPPIAPPAPQDTPPRPPGSADGPLTLAPGSLLMPVQGLDPAQLQDNYHQRRGDAPHEALDIMAPRGTPVVAVADGRVAKLFTSKPGGLTVYQFDRNERLVYYYAHLDRYAEGLAEGQLLRRGDPVGAVGSTGNARQDAPHLHFAVHVLGVERAWWKGTPVNPYPLIAGSASPPPALAARQASDAPLRR